MKYGATMDIGSGFKGTEKSREAAIWDIVAGYLDSRQLHEIDRPVVVWTCIASPQEAANFVPSPDLITDMMADNAQCACGEWADDFPDVDDEGEKALTVALIKWANEHVTKPLFYSPVSIQRHELFVEKDALGNPYVSMLGTSEADDHGRPIEKPPALQPSP